MTTPQITAGDAGPLQQAHDLAIDALVKETHVGIERVRELYEAEHSRLAAQARIKTYVSVFATRIVRNTLQESTHTGLQ